MTCYGDGHSWSYAATETSGYPPAGMPCACGQYISLGDQGMTDNTTRTVEATMPSGRCPQCGKPWDDHRKGMCPK